MSNILEEMKKLVVKVSTDSHFKGELTGDTRFVEDLGLNSINVIMLVTLMEQSFNLELTSRMEDLLQCPCIGSTAKYVDGLLELA